MTSDLSTGSSSWLEIDLFRPIFVSSYGHTCAVPLQTFNVTLTTIYHCFDYLPSYSPFEFIIYFSVNYQIIIFIPDAPIRSQYKVLCFIENFLDFGCFTTMPFKLAPTTRQL